VKLVRKGAALVGSCPFHAGAKTTATLTIEPKPNTWACSKCKVKSAGVVEWTMRAEGISRRHAIELLRADHGIGSGKLVKQSTTTKLPVLTADPDEAKLMTQVVGYYRETLTRASGTPRSSSASTSACPTERWATGYRR
jgi:DNA primase